MEHPSLDGKAGGVCPARADRLWTVHELEILQELPTPVVVLLHETKRYFRIDSLDLLKLPEMSLYKTQHTLRVLLTMHPRRKMSVPCRGVAQHGCHMLFGNASFLQRFGPPRSPVEYSAAWTRLSEAKQATKHSYTTHILQVASSAGLAHDPLFPLL